MENRKWLKRKYPNSYDELDKYFNDDQLCDFKRSRRKIGRLKNAIFNMDGSMYDIGTLIQFKRSNPIRDYNYPDVYCIAKCDPGYTASGYHSFTIHDKDFIELFD